MARDTVKTLIFSHQLILLLKQSQPRWLLYHWKQQQPFASRADIENQELSRCQLCRYWLDCMLFLYCNQRRQNWHPGGFLFSAGQAVDTTNIPFLYVLLRWDRELLLWRNSTSLSVIYFWYWSFWSFTNTHADTYSQIGTDLTSLLAAYWIYHHQFYLIQLSYHPNTSLKRNIARVFAHVF